MLIKNYTTNGNLYLLSDVGNVSVNNNRKSEDLDDVTNVYCHEPIDDIQQNKTKGRIIEFSDKDGDWCLLTVYNVAYICSDEGKTIEKVYVN